MRSPFYMTHIIFIAWTRLLSDPTVATAVAFVIKPH